MLHYYVLKIIVHILFDCFIRVYQIILNVLQYDYCTSNQDYAKYGRARAPPSAPHAPLQLH